MRKQMNESMADFEKRQAKETSQMIDPRTNEAVVLELCDAEVVTLFNKQHIYHEKALFVRATLARTVQCTNSTLFHSTMPSVDYRKTFMYKCIEVLNNPAMWAHLLTSESSMDSSPYVGFWAAVQCLVSDGGKPNALYTASNNPVIRLVEWIDAWKMPVAPLLLALCHIAARKMTQLRPSISVEAMLHVMKAVLSGVPGSKDHKFGESVKVTVPWKCDWQDLVFVVERICRWYTESEAGRLMANLGDSMRVLIYNAYSSGLNKQASTALKEFEERNQEYKKTMVELDLLESVLNKDSTRRRASWEERKLISDNRFEQRCGLVKKEWNSMCSKAKDLALRAPLLVSDQKKKQIRMLMDPNARVRAEGARAAENEAAAIHQRKERADAQLAELRRCEQLEDADEVQHQVAAHGQSDVVGRSRAAHVQAPFRANEDIMCQSEESEHDASEYNDDESEGGEVEDQEETHVTQTEAPSQNPPAHARQSSSDDEASGDDWLDPEERATEKERKRVERKPAKRARFC